MQGPKKSDISPVMEPDETKALALMQQIRTLRKDHPEIVGNWEERHKIGRGDEEG